MFNRLEQIIKKVEGNVLVIGLNNKLIDAFDRNNRVNLYSISSNTSVGLTKSKNRKTNKGKNINIKKLRKYINKKSVDYLFCNMNEMFEYYKYFIKDSIYLNANTIYIYATNDIDKDFIISRYKRYNVEITVTDYKNGYILAIDNSKGKTNFLKDKINFLKDTFYNVAEFIGNILVS